MVQPEDIGGTDKEEFATFMQGSFCAGGIISCLSGTMKSGRVSKTLDKTFNGAKLIFKIIFFQSVGVRSWVKLNQYIKD
jgi:hypothetical protein